MNVASVELCMFITLKLNDFVLIDHPSLGAREITRGEGLGRSLSIRSEAKLPTCRDQN